MNGCRCLPSGVVPVDWFPSAASDIVFIILVSVVSAGLEIRDKTGSVIVWIRAWNFEFGNPILECPMGTVLCLSIWRRGKISNFNS